MTAIDFSRCSVAPACQPRAFWTTQPDACGAGVDDCGAPCGAIGHRLIATTDGVTIDTSHAVRSLIINTLSTRGRGEDRVCGYQPGQRGGHWTEAFMGAGVRVGALFNELPLTGSIVDAVLAVERVAVAALAWMKDAGIVAEIEVTARYAGRGMVDLIIAPTLPNGGPAERVGLSGTRSATAWNWSF